ncbi:MAG: hypothetical protein ABFQ53_02595 [Patescibacteria group bacterium]
MIRNLARVVVFFVSIFVGLALGKANAQEDYFWSKTPKESWAKEKLEKFIDEPKASCSYKKKAARIIWRHKISIYLDKRQEAKEPFGKELSKSDSECFTKETIEKVLEKL